MRTMVEVAAVAAADGCWAGTESDLDRETMQWSRTIENIIDENPDLWTAEETAELAERQRFLREQEERYEQDVRAGVIVEMEWPGDREFDSDAAVPDDPHERDECVNTLGSCTTRYLCHLRLQHMHACELCMKYHVT